MNYLKSLLFFAGLLILSRLIPHPPNFSPLIAGAVFLPFMFNDKTIVILLPLVCLFFSDLIIGFHNVMLWTYGAFLIIGLTVIYFSKLNLKTLIGLSLSGPTFFYLITNFGVWISSTTYTKDIYGILECYFLALPFFVNSIASTLIFSLTFFTIRYWVLRKSSQLI
tara:strand:+ start:98 stop:595 length:498 start_codon:yes stop_codon:yes gene_type:complete